MDKFKFSFSASAATAVLSLLLLTPATWAQDATGKIAGNITDATGAVVPGAMVLVTNLDTKISKRTVTNSQGFYQVLQLPIGHYEVSAEATGFSKIITRPANPLEINQTLRVDLGLEVGATPATLKPGTPPSAVPSPAKPSSSFPSTGATPWTCWPASQA